MIKTNYIERDELILRMIFRGARWGLLAGLVCGIIGGFPIFGLGALFGMALGIPFGIVLGGANGLLLGIVTVVFFFHYAQPVKYRIVTALTCVPLSAVVTYQWLGSMFHNPVGDNSYLLVLTGLGALAALYVSQRIAD
jgi:hypothetical protein